VRAVAAALAPGGLDAGEHRPQHLVLHALILQSHSSVSPRPLVRAAGGGQQERGGGDGAHLDERGEANAAECQNGELGALHRQQAQPPRQGLYQDEERRTSERSAARHS